jgi:RNA polymerase sigma-70 factor (ECF subfamily)
MSRAFDATEEALKTQRKWLLRLAQSLVRDPGQAEDLVQQASLAALHRPPQSQSSLRQWLRRVLRNMLRQQLRSESRREVHEARTPRRGPDTPTADLVAEIELQRKVASAALQLAEPYRTVILQRYYAERSIAEIAAAQDAPERTVETRLRRAREILREKLDAVHTGGRQAWLLGLKQWTGSMAATESVVVSTIGSSALWIGGGLAAALLAAVSIQYLSPEPAPAGQGLIATMGGIAASDPGERIPTPTAKVEAETGSGIHPMAAPARTQLQTTPRPRAAASSPVDTSSVQSESIHGLVLGPRQQPVAGAEVWIWKGSQIRRPPDQRIQTDSNGRFHQDLAGSRPPLNSLPFAPANPRGFSLWARTADLCSASYWTCRTLPLDLSAEIVIELVESQRVEGRVLAADLGPVAKAQVHFHSECRRQKAAAAVTEHPFLVSTPRRESAVSDAEGYFTLQAPRRLGLYLTVLAQGHRPYRGSTDDRSVQRTIVLEPGYELRGRLLPPAGGSLKGADLRVYVDGKLMYSNWRISPDQCLSLREKDQQLDAEGNFTLQGLPLTDNATLLVDAPGCAFQTVTGVRIGPSTPALRVVLQKELQVAGNLRDAAGQPLPAIRLHLKPCDPPASGWESYREAGLRQSTKPSGAFLFQMLRAGTYRLEARQDKSNQAIAVRMVQAGDLEVRLTIGEGLESATSFTGTALLSNGLPVTTLTVYAWSHKGEGEPRKADAQRFVCKDPTGAFEVGGLQAGYWSLDFWSGSGEFTRIPARYFGAGVHRLDPLLSE